MSSKRYPKATDLAKTKFLHATGFLNSLLLQNLQKSTLVNLLVPCAPVSLAKAELLHGKVGFAKKELVHKLVHTHGAIEEVRKNFVFAIALFNFYIVLFHVVKHVVLYL